LLVQAGIAHAALADAPTRASASDKHFYQGKIATATFFARNMLPKLTAQVSVIESLDNDIMRVSEDAF
jgi:Acetyl-CoA dehydrogenase C-terminal like